MTGTRAPAQVSDLTRPFWQAAARHELVRQVCATCGHSFFTPQVACPNCLGEDWTWEPSSGRGAIHSFTVVHRAPREGDDVPYVVADVDLEENWNMMTNVVGCEPEQVRIGAPVRVAWRAVDDPSAEVGVVPVFTLDDVDVA